MQTGLLHKTDELRKLILENPELPMLVFASEDMMVTDVYPYVSCSRVSAQIGEFLDYDQDVNPEKCYTDRDDLEEDFAYIEADYFKGTSEQFDAYIAEEMKKYEPYWKPCIIVYVGN